MRLSHLVLSCLAGSTLAAGPAAAEVVYGITSTQSFVSALVSFDSANPNSMTIVGPIQGVVSGQTLQAIDFRPANGLLYAVSANATGGQLYTLNLATGALTTVGGGFLLAGNTSDTVSIDFNPVVDRLRVVTGSGQNYRVNPITGALVARDTDLSPSGRFIADVAYTNNVAGATSTTLYGYDFIADQLDTIGSVGGAPVSPNSGQTFVVGDSGLLSASEIIGLDISGATGIAYASVNDQLESAISGFYTVDLATGLHTFVGQEGFFLQDFSVMTAAAVGAVPEPDALALLGLGGAALGVVTRRRRRQAA